MSAPFFSALHGVVIHFFEIVILSAGAPVLRAGVEGRILSTISCIGWSTPSGVHRSTI